MEIQKAKIEVGYNANNLTVKSGVENGGLVGDYIVVSTRQLR